MTEYKKNWLTTTTGVITSITAALAAITAFIVTVAGLPFWSNTADENNAHTVQMVDINSVTKAAWISRDYYRSGETANFEFFYDGKIVRAKYNNPNEDAKIIDGAVRHELSSGAMTVDAIWVESKSKQQCATARNGTYFWGKINFMFTSDSAFVGHWGYCDSTPDNAFTGGAI